MKQIASLLFALLLLGAVSAAQTQTTGYVGVGGGFSHGLGFQTGDFTLDGGVNTFHKKIFAEGEFGFDTGNLEVFAAGNTLRAHGLLMYQGRQHWWFGGGLHYAEVISEPLDQLNQFWIVGSAMYQRRRFRINNEYLYPLGGHFITGPLFDLRYRIVKGFYYRERFGLFFYHDPNQTAPPTYRGGEADFGIIYVIHDHPQDE